MTRLVLFVIFCISVIAVISLGPFKKQKISNERFSYEKEKAAYIKKEAELAALMAPKVEKKVEKVEKKVVEVVLDTPALQRGHALYQKKCVVCHGKRGEGKKSQKAPKVAGQFTWYIEKQLNDMKNKIRFNKVMDPYIRKLSGQDFKDLSAYIAKIPW